MKWSIRIMSIAGISVQVHATFLFLIIWIALSYWQVFGTIGAVAQGVGVILALFFCVVLHELGHALTARRFGIGTHNITLLPIGGVASIEKMPDSPRQEIAIALAGPGVSLAIALLLWAVLVLTGGLVPAAEMGPSGGPFLQRLMALNLLLAVFNLIPAFPMDGGRVLHALLCMRMDAVKATRKAAGVGQFIALLFALLGLLYNPFLFLIAVFIWVGAATEARAATVKQALSGVTAAQAMLVDFNVLRPEDPLGRAVELTLSGSQKDFPVLEGDRVAGVVMQEALIRGIREGGEQVPVSGIMQPAIADVRPGDSMESVLELMQENPRGLVTVTERGRLAGVINLDNVFELLRVRAAAEDNRSR